MTERRPERAALYAVLINSISTCLKFVMAWLTGSIAVAAEAYHSFSDIITSALVYIAIRVDRVNQIGQEAEEDEEARDKSTRSLKFFRAKFEGGISFLIGLFLMAIAVQVLYRASIGSQQTIEKSILAGIVLLVAAMCSYLLSQFELAVGKATGSMALVADGHHSRVDMLGALLVSMSLFANAAGLNIDVLAAAIIGFLILLQAIETLVNVLRSALVENSEEDKPLFYVHQQQIVSEFLFDATAGERALSSLESLLGYEFSQTRLYRFLRYQLPFFLFLSVLLGWLSTGVSMIGMEEQGLVFRFGRLIEGNPLSPGLCLTCPWPIDTLYRYPVRRIKRATVGFKGQTTSDKILWTKQHHEVEYEMLTGDAQFITVFMTVDYHVNNILKYHLVASNPDELLEGIANATLLKVLADLDFFQIAIEGRRERELLLQQRIQKESDGLGLGLVIDTVAFKDIHPPVSVAPQFEAVISAEEERETKVNEREAVRNRLLPMARAQAKRKVAEAEAYRVATLGKAKGQAERFELRRNFDSSVKTVQKLTLRRAAQLEGLKNPVKILVGRGCSPPSIVLVPAGGADLNDLGSTYGN